MIYTCINVKYLLASLYQGLKILTITFKIDFQDSKMDDKIWFSLMTAIKSILVVEGQVNII